MTNCVCCVMYHLVTRQPAGCAHISDLAEIIYYLGISKAQRRKLLGIPPDTSIRRIVRISPGQRSMLFLTKNIKLNYYNLIDNLLLSNLFYC
jgi:hypothetical protein